jgi:hypothetical protein
MAVEISELTPWLLSDEESLQVSSGSTDISAKSYFHEGRLLILAVNKINAPVKASFSISRPFRGKVDVVFENRFVTINGGSFSDVLSSYGSQAYMIELNPLSETVKPWKSNLVIDPGFEDTSSPGVPASCYARGNGERGATYFLDTREHVEGYHSLRITTPVENGSPKMRFFPVPSRNGATYLISVWAKNDKEQGLNINTDKSHYFSISLGDFGTTRFQLENDWKQFVTFVTIPYFADFTPKTNIILQMPSAGVSWFDMLQVVEFVDIGKCINPELKLPGREF